MIGLYQRFEIFVVLAVIHNSIIKALIRYRKQLLSAFESLKALKDLFIIANDFVAVKTVYLHCEVLYILLVQLLPGYNHR